MKKVFVLLLALSLCLFLSACGDGASRSGEQGAASDLAYVRDKGTLTVGITEFRPMDYQNAEGRWIGFDAEMAAAFADVLGVKAEFKVIEWENKVALLNDKTVDVVWNGMTLNDEIKATMETSKPYFNNAQVVVVKTGIANRYQTAESVADMSFAVESGSAGKQQAAARGYAYTEVADQVSALQSVSSGETDAAIVDFLMAIAMIGEGTRYGDLTYTVSLSSEEYGVGFRKGSDLAAALNDFFAASYDDSTMQAIARKYNITAFLLPQ